jgi:hypothetical protein
MAISLRVSGIQLCGINSNILSRRLMSLWFKCPMLIKQYSILNKQCSINQYYRETPKTKWNGYIFGYLDSAIEN